MAFHISISCPRCGGQLKVRHNRPRGFIARWGYQAVCGVCGWREDLQEAWCENCSRMNHIMRVADGWVCVRCGKNID